MRDWRVTQLRKLANVDVFVDSELSPGGILDFGFQHVVLATGARWRTDGIGRANVRPITVEAAGLVATPDDILSGRTVAGPVLIFDDDHYYMGTVLSERLALAGVAVTLATPAAEVAAFTINTLELSRIPKRLDGLQVRMVTHHNLVELASGRARLRHVHTGRVMELPATTTVMVTARVPEDGLFTALKMRSGQFAAAGIKSIGRIGHCLAPSRHLSRDLCWASLRPRVSGEIAGSSI